MKRLTRLPALTGRTALRALPALALCTAAHPAWAQA